MRPKKLVSTFGVLLIGYIAIRTFEAYSTELNLHAPFTASDFLKLHTSSDVGRHPAASGAFAQEAEQGAAQVDDDLLQVGPEIQTPTPSAPPTNPLTPTPSEPPPPPHTLPALTTKVEQTQPRPDYSWLYFPWDTRNCNNRLVGRFQERMFVCQDKHGNNKTWDKCPGDPKYSMNCPKHVPVNVGVVGGCGNFIPFPSDNAEVVSGCTNFTDDCEIRCKEGYPVVVQGDQKLKCKHDRYNDNKFWYEKPLRCHKLEEEEEPHSYKDESGDASEDLNPEEYLPPVRLAPTAFYSYTHRDGRVTVERIRMSGRNSCDKDTVVYLPSGNYTLRYESGAWNYHKGEDGSWSVTGFTISLRHAETLETKIVYEAPPASENADSLTSEGLSPHFLDYIHVPESLELVFRIQDPEGSNSCFDNKNAVTIGLSLFQRGCAPMIGIARPNLDFETLKVDEGSSGDWNWCCDQCTKEKECRSWVYNKEDKSCDLKRGIPDDVIPTSLNEDRKVDVTDTISGFKPTAIPWNSGRHEPKKLMLISHPDDEAIFAGEALAEGFHSDWFNDWYIVTISAEYVNDRKMDQRDAMDLVHAGYEIWVYSDLFCWSKGPCSPLHLDQVKDIAAVLSEREWTDIVTHNLVGEYGNPYHCAVNYVMQHLHKARAPQANLYVFNPRPEGDIFTVHGYNPRLPTTYLSGIKHGIMRAYGRFVDRTVHYNAWYENRVLIQDFNRTGAQYVCEEWGQGYDNICCLGKCIEDLSWMLEGLI